MVLGGGAYIRSGGQLARFAAKWTGAPRLPATTARRGFHWSWVSIPPSLCLPSTTQHQPALRDPILDWVCKGVVAPVPPQPCFLSHLFAVPHPDNRPPRLIINLSSKIMIASLPYAIASSQIHLRLWQAKSCTPEDVSRPSVLHADRCSSVLCVCSLC